MSGEHWRGWIAQIGMRRPGTLVWARAQLGDPHLTRDEWAEFIEYQAAHLTPAQVDAFAPWVHHREPGCACGECVPALSFTEQEAARNARGGSEGLMPTIEATFVAMQDSVNRTVERIEMARRTGAVPPRPCCHTTGPNHHPACQESK